MGLLKLWVGKIAGKLLRLLGPYGILLGLLLGGFMVASRTVRMVRENGDLLCLS